LGIPLKSSPFLLVNEGQIIFFLIFQNILSDIPFDTSLKSKSKHKNRSKIIFKCYCLFYSLRYYLNFNNKFIIRTLYYRSLDDVASLRDVLTSLFVGKFHSLLSRHSWRLFLKKYCRFVCRTFTELNLSFCLHSIVLEYILKLINKSMLSSYFSLH
jgi:hypothetical protein